MLQPMRLQRAGQISDRTTATTGVQIKESVFHRLYPTMGFPRGLSGKESVCSAGDMRLIPGFRRSPRERNDNPL